MALVETSQILLASTSLLESNVNLSSSDQHSTEMNKELKKSHVAQDITISNNLLVVFIWDLNLIIDLIIDLIEINYLNLVCFKNRSKWEILT